MQSANHDDSNVSSQVELNTVKHDMQNDDHMHSSQVDQEDDSIQVKQEHNHVDSNLRTQVEPVHQDSLFESPLFEDSRCEGGAMSDTGGGKKKKAVVETGTKI